MSQGKVSVESIDDKEDMLFADEAFDILGFTKEEKFNVYKMTAVVMHLGELKFKAKSSKDEQAIADESEAIARVAKLIGTDKDWLYENFEHPKIKVRSVWPQLSLLHPRVIKLLFFAKVGSEWVVKGQTVAQANNAVAGIARGIFERMFRYLVQKANDTLVDPSMRK